MSKSTKVVKTGDRFMAISDLKNSEERASKTPGKGQLCRMFPEKVHSP